VTRFEVTVHVDVDDQPIYRLHIDPRCLTIGAERGLGPKLHLEHVAHCRCGDLSARLVERELADQ
jgi:hypothetical protein